MNKSVSYFVFIIAILFLSVKNGNSGIMKSEIDTNKLLRQRRTTVIAPELRCTYGQRMAIKCIITTGKSINVTV